MSASGGANVASAFLHHAFFYGDDDDYVSVLADFVAAGVEADEAVLVAVPSPRTGLLRDAMPPDSASVRLVDMRDLGRNPGRIIPLWHEFVARNAVAGRRVRGIGEPVWAGRSAAELVECQRHEELLNLAFAHGPAFPLLCPYDARVLPVDVLDAARRSHPFLYTEGSLEPTGVFAGLLTADDDHDVPLSAPPASSELLAFGPRDLPPVREFVYARAVAAGLTSHHAADLVLAVNEVASNSLRHGGGRGAVRAWIERAQPGVAGARESFICEVRDGGRVGSALAGRNLTVHDALGGRGLWLVHQLCDLVELRSGCFGTTVRMRFYLPDAG